MRPKWTLLSKLRITFLTLFYNHFLSPSYVFDTLMEPILWIVDSFTKVMGPVFVIGVIALNVSVVFVAYRIGLPFYWKKSPPLAVFLVILGQYFKVNVIFYYYKAYTTPPGFPPSSGRPPPQVTSICKKCINPKPPRTHHCSVCDTCVLKMDHHCPWLNNCVGHLNHRYFFLYMVYTILGCIFIMIFGFEILYLTVFHGVPSNPKVTSTLFSDRTLIFYAGFMTVTTSLILGGLTYWHSCLISRGETSIEAHINRAETLRLAKEGLDYVNPYDFGVLNNWRLFLGIIEGRAWKSLLVPRSVAPKGDGLTWDTVYSCSIRWSDKDL